MNTEMNMAMAGQAAQAAQAAIAGEEKGRRLQRFRSEVEGAQGAGARVRLLVEFLRSGEPSKAAVPPSSPAAKLDDLRMTQVMRLLNRHPGAPMAMLSLSQVKHPLRRVQELLVYIGKQANEVTLDNASDQGSGTIYVSEKHVHDLMQALDSQYHGERMDILQLREQAREQVMAEFLGMALDTAQELREIVRSDWAMGEMSERKRLYGDPNAAAEPPASAPARAAAPARAGTGFSRPAAPARATGFSMGPRGAN